MNKRGLSILLVLCMLFSLMPALNMNANAAGGVLAKMDQAESVWPNGSHYVESANAGGAKTCYGFARELFLYVFGRTLPGYFGVNDPAAMFCDASGNPVYTNVVLIGHYERSSYTVDALKSLIAQSKPGDILIGSNGSTNHIMMIHSVDGNIGAVTVYDANSDGNNTIYTHRYFTAQQFRNWKTLAVSLYRASNYDEIDGVPNPPAAPTVSATSTSIYEGQSVTFSWNAVPGATSYYFRAYNASTGADFYSTNIGAATAQTLTFATGQAGTYNIVVSSVNDGGYTPASPVTVTVRESNILAQGSCGDNVTWVLDKNGTLTISGTGAMYNYEWSSSSSSTAPWADYRKTIKSVVIQSGVTSIGNFAFEGCSNLTSVTIPSSVTSIGSRAFCGCSSLTNVAIPASVTSIGSQVFYLCSGLTSVTIPEGVTSIGSQAFSNCSNLTSVTIPESVTSIGSEAFRSCTSLTSITIPAGVTSIGSQTFSDCSSLKSVTFSEGVTSIGIFVFENCSNLTTVRIPSTVTSVGYSAFDDCSSLQDVYYSGTEAQKAAISIGNYNDPLLNANWNYIGTCGDHVTWRFSNGVLTISGTGVMTDYINSSRVPWADFRANIKSAVIESGVTSIGMQAFSDCRSLTSVTIPSSVTSISGWAFQSCSSLTSVTIPEGVTSIGQSAFSSCSSLTSVTIPSSVTSIESDTFWGCGSLTSVTIPSGVTSIGRGAFSSCSSLTSVTIPSGVMSIESNAFWGCSSLTSVTIPASVTNIGEAAFSGCSSLKSVTIPASVTSIGIGAFRHCRSLTSIEVDEGNPVYTSVEGVLYNKGVTELVACPGGLTSVVIPASVTSIGDHAFFGCSNLTNVTIPASVTNIGEAAFSGCSSLTNVTIPESVTSIGTDAFMYCSSLTSVTIPESVTSIGAGAFTYCYKLTSVTLPASVTSIEGSVFHDCYSLKSVTIPSSVTSIGNYSFLGCNSLTDVTIPASVTSIEGGAFYNCSSLTDVHFCGTEAQKAAMTIGDSNDSLLNAAWTYGHIWDAGVVMQEPTVTTEGVKKFTCTACGETKTEAIPMLGNPFTDVAAGKFYYAPVLWAISQDPQITTGVTATTFAPDRICTRAHVVTFLWRANGCPEPKLTANPFKDVPKDKYYYKAVLWAAENGITTGYADNTFRPDDECSRGQVVTFLWRAKGQPEPTSTANPFADVASGQYYTTAVLWALEAGVTNGRTATLFGTTDACTRGHVVTFLYRAYAD